MARQIIRVVGARELEKALNELGVRVAKRIVRRGWKRAAQRVVDHARSLAPARLGYLRRSIGFTTQTLRSVRRRRIQRKGDVVGFVGPNYAPRKGAFARYAHLVEFGTGPRRHRSGRSVGAMPARPFMRPAWEANRHGVLEDFTRMVVEELERERKRAVLRAARGRPKG